MGKDLGSKEWYDWSLVAFVRTAAGIDLSVGPTKFSWRQGNCYIVNSSDQPYCFKDDYENGYILFESFRDWARWKGS